MKRNRGTFNFSANFEPRVRAPLDARQRVAEYSDLFNSSTWIDSEGLEWLYDGMIVSVNGPSNMRGVYQLEDRNLYEDPSSWVKIGPHKERISTFVSIFPPDTEQEGDIWIKEDTLERYYLYDTGEALAWVQALVFSPLLDIDVSTLNIDIVDSEDIDDELNEGFVIVQASGGIGTIYYTLVETGETNTSGVFSVDTPGIYNVMVTDYTQIPLESGPIEVNMITYPYLTDEDGNILTDEDGNLLMADI